MKRATEREDNMIVIGAISIHALVKRATEREDNMIVIGAISIHALVKRATKRGFDRSGKVDHFNPRPREEGDKFYVFFFILCHRFQSTPS